jgi:hypothetical protein
MNQLALAIQFLYLIESTAFAIALEIAESWQEIDLVVAIVVVVVELIVASVVVVAIVVAAVATADLAVVS